MKKVIFALIIALSLGSCNAQEKKSEAKNQSALNDQPEAQTEPRGTWKVNKEVDENGNLIRYDSIYSYSYGNINGREMKPQEMDSAMVSFRKYMEERMPNSFSQDFMIPFENDSLGNGFFEKGFFENHWEDFFPDMQKQLKRMDSLHQQFFQNAQPGLFPLEDKKNRS